MTNRRRQGHHFEWGLVNDKIMHAAMLLMKHNDDLLPLSSLQDPILGESLNFEVACGESVQILHSGGNHWVTVSTVGTAGPTNKPQTTKQPLPTKTPPYQDSSAKYPIVRVYDSLYSGLPWGTMEQIAALLFAKESTITLEYANVQVCVCLLTIPFLFSD